MNPSEAQISKLREACQATANLLPIIRKFIDNADVSDTIPEHVRIVLVEALEDAEAKVEAALAESQP